MRSRIIVMGFVALLAVRDEVVARTGAPSSPAQTAPTNKAPPRPNTRVGHSGQGYSARFCRVSAEEIYVDDPGHRRGRRVGDPPGRSLH